MILADLAKHAFDGFGMQSRVLHFFEFLIGRIKVILGPLAELTASNIDNMEVSISSRSELLFETLLRAYKASPGSFSASFPIES